MKRVNFFISERMDKMAVKIAEDLEMTKSQVIRSALVAFIKEWRDKNEPDAVNISGRVSDTTSR